MAEINIKEIINDAVEKIMKDEKLQKQFMDEPVKIEDTDIEYTENTLHAHVIIDGNIMEKNLHSLGFDVNWLNRRLKEIHAEKPENILLAIASSNNDLIVFNKNETISHNDYFI